jgi:hypothetical protein
VTDLFIAVALFAGSAFLFWICLPREGKQRWFIGTVWEPYIVAALVIVSVASAGHIAWSIIGILL